MNPAIKFSLYSSWVQLLYYQENHPDSWTEGKQHLVAAIALSTMKALGSVPHHIVVLFTP